MALLEADLNDVSKAITVIESAAKLPARSRATNVVPFVEEVCEHAYEYGLPATQLKQIIDIIAVKNELDQTSRTSLVRNLVPAAPVQSVVVLAIVGSLGNGSSKPPAMTQALLLRWIAAVHDVLEDPSVLPRVYGVLFNLLDLISLRAPLSQLLSLITRRKHVRPFRIQRLLTLCQQFGNDLSLVILLRVYKNFCPEIIVDGTSSGRLPQSPFDAEWRARLVAVQSTASELNTGNIVTGFKVQRRTTRGLKSSTIPEVQTFYGEEGVVTLEDINTASELANTLERIEPPSQLIAALGDKLLQRYITLDVSHDLQPRLGFWLERHLEDEIELLKEGFGASTTLHDVLSGILDLAEFQKSLNPVAERFLMAYLPHWNGSTELGLLSDLLIYISPKNFSDAYASMLLPWERAVLSTARDSFSTIFDMYAKLACRWLCSAADGVAGSKPASVACLDALHEHVSKLMLSALTSTSTATVAIVHYLEAVSDTIVGLIKGLERPGLPMLKLPDEVFYLLLFSSSLATVSGLCGILDRLYRSILDSPRAVPAAFTSSINTYLMDSCNVLYRARAFVTSDKNSQGCLCPRLTSDELQFYLPKVDREHSLAAIFGLSSHPLISCIAATSFKQLEANRADSARVAGVWHSGPVGQRSLVALANEGGVDIGWKEYRIHVLKALSVNGLDGIEKFLYAIIKDLTA